jgi:hypothetical protein
VRWVRRNPAIAAQEAAVVLALVGGVAFSLYYAFDARAQAEQAGRNETSAIEREEEAEEAAADLAKTNKQLETTLARSLLRPLATRNMPLRDLGFWGMTDAEVEAVWELVGSPQGVRDRFVEEALRGGSTARQLRDRAAPAIHAVVGLDVRRRAAVERLLVDRLRDPSCGQEQRLAVAWVAVALGDLTPRAVALVRRVLTEALGHTTDLSALGDALVGLPGRGGPAAATALAQAMRRTPFMSGTLVPHLSALLGRLEAGEAARICAPAANTVLRIMTQETNAAEDLAQSLAMLAVYLKPADAERVCGQAVRHLAQLIMGIRDIDVRIARGLAEAIARLAGHLKREMVRTDAGLLAEAVAKSTVANAQCRWSFLLAGLAGCLGPEDRTRPCALSAAALVRSMRKENDPKSLVLLVGALSALADRMGPAEAARHCAPALTRIAEVLVKSTHPDALADLPSPLVDLAKRLGPREADAVGVALFRAIPRALASGRGMGGMQDALRLLADHLSPKAAGECAADVARLMARPQGPGVLPQLANCLSVMAGRLGPAEAARVCRPAANSVLAVLRKSTAVPANFFQLAGVLSPLAEHLGPGEAAPIAAVLARTICKSTNPAVAQVLTVPLARLAQRLPPADSARLCSPVVRSLVRTIPKDSRFSGWGSRDARWAWAKALALLASCLEPGETVARLTEAMNRTTYPDAQIALAQGLWGVRDRLSPEKATVLAKALIDANAKSMMTGSVGSEEARRASAVTGLRTVLVQVHPMEDLPRAHAVFALANSGNRTVQSMARMMSLPGFEPARRASAVAALVGCLAQTRQPVPALAAVGWTLTPPTCRLTTPQLVELLKQPTCTGPSRRAVLDQLEVRYRRPFADHWAFVRFARQKKLDLDFLSPPRRAVLAAERPQK